MTATIKTVKLSANLRAIADAKTIDVPVNDDATARDLLYAIRQVNPALGDRVLSVDGQLGTGIQFLVDGRHIDFLQGLDTPISNVTQFMLIPPVFGG
ncbi:MAG: MoaD/ThiS family protein [Anaerolineae bacterium]|nr:MoaD/ThiS family protein [Anaerolineae bacterium]